LTRPGANERPRRSLFVVAFLAGVATIVLVGCRPAVPTRDPSFTGVVASREFVSGSVVRYRLGPGAQLEVDLDIVTTLAGGTPDVGDLLLYGELPQPWLLALEPSAEGGFEIWSRPAQRDDGRLTFDSGLRLPLAPGYRESGNGPVEAGATVQYRLNEIGEVVART
jgi:hypothetical protein